MVELNMDKLNKRIKGTISTEEAIKDVIPIKWPDEVLSGQKQVIISNIQEEKECVKLETLYS